MSHTKLVILAGGASSRMKKQATADSTISAEELAQANSRSKGLISIDGSGRPLMDYLLYHAKKAGYETVYIITGEDNELFKSFYGENNNGNNYHGLTVNFAIQYIPEDRVKPFGTADALYQAVDQYPELQKEPYTVCNSDNLYSIESLQLLRETEAKNALISYDRGGLIFPEERISRFALMQFREGNFMKAIVEKPALEDIESYKDTEGKLRVSMNVFKFNGEQMYPYLKDCPVHPERNEKELPTALMNMIADDAKATLGIPLKAHVPDLTSKQDIASLKEYVATIDMSAW